MQRRAFLKYGGATVAALSAGTSVVAVDSPSPPACPPLRVGHEFGDSPLALIRAVPDRIISLTVCTRPFREQGARIESEKLGRKTIVHNYGHGGSGWSLSWGSAALAVRAVLETREREIAVIGCGVIGLTSAIMAQRAGLKVRIYAKDRPPEVRSNLATGNWSPNSRYCTRDALTPDIEARWEEMARISFRMYQNLLGLPGDPIEWRDFYFLSDSGFAPHGHGLEGEPAYAPLDPKIRDITPFAREYPYGSTPFGAIAVRRAPNLVFNLPSYSRMLISDFEAAGGGIETREFERPGDLSKLKEKTIINATGYGARALFGDESIIPVRGQLMRLIPQPEVTYGLNYNDAVYTVPRRDGIIVQSQAPGDFGNADTTTDRAAAERSVAILAALNDRIRVSAGCG
jgi:glycine/D-amino acid oxidase-like deaminating enzyme